MSEGEKQSMGKPTKVVSGQRWEYGEPDSRTRYTILRWERDGEDKGWRVQWEDGNESLTLFKDHNVLCDDYLGMVGPPETPEAPKPAKGQRWRYIGVGLGHGLDTGAVYTLDDISHGTTWNASKRRTDGSVSSNWLINGAWFNHCEFVDHGQPAGDGITDDTEAAKLLAPRKLVSRDELLVKYGQGRLVGETRAPDGLPISALSRVPCKRSSDDKPPPPFIPSIDDDFWIPDAPRGGR